MGRRKGGGSAGSIAAHCRGGSGGRRGMGELRKEKEAPLRTVSRASAGLAVPRAAHTQGDAGWRVSDVGARCLVRCEARIVVSERSRQARTHARTRPHCCAQRQHASPIAASTDAVCRSHVLLRPAACSVAHRSRQSPRSIAPISCWWLRSPKHLAPGPPHPRHTSPRLPSRHALPKSAVTARACWPTALPAASTALLPCQAYHPSQLSYRGNASLRSIAQTGRGATRN